MSSLLQHCLLASSSSINSLAVPAQLQLMAEEQVVHGKFVFGMIMKGGMRSVTEKDVKDVIVTVRYTLGITCCCSKWFYHTAGQHVTMTVGNLFDSTSTLNVKDVLTSYDPLWPQQSSLNSFVRQ